MLMVIAIHIENNNNNGGYAFDKKGSHLLSYNILTYFIY